MADCKRGKSVSIPPLPLELVFEILLLIPAEILHNIMRCVCKDWYNIIHDTSFVSSHLLRASSGMVLGCYPKLYSNSVHYLDTSGCEIKLKKEELPWKTNIVTSCNGLWLLEATIDNNFPYYVANPVTKKLLGLPAPRKYHFFRVVGLGYAASIGAYKVVSVLKDLIREEGGTGLRYYPKEFIGVLTLGVDKSWRCIGAGDDETSYDHQWQFPLLIKGFIHWMNCETNAIRALDVDTELFHSFNAPKLLQINYCRPMAMGDYLALLFIQPNRLVCEVWVAREMKRAGEEWTRLPDVSLGSRYLYKQICKDNRRLGLRLTGWLKEAELVFLRTTVQPKDLFVFNTKTGVISKLESGDYDWQSYILPYVPSLVSI